MSKKILVIDDSTTIRRLADSVLSQAGYHVVLAPNAEDGLRLAQEIKPDLILLDHQLPGTTGFEVCRQLLEISPLSSIPVVISSTLRKRAYVQYADMSNVVDMLPKPYTPELLAMTVGNALDTAKIVVASQVDGSAVPEVIQEASEVDLSGTFRNFQLRELLDFLNNVAKTGTLEVESGNSRLYFYLSEGRVQGVSATGVEPQAVMGTLPETLQSLAPVLNYTFRGRSCAEVDGMVELLDRKVLDPRLLRRLLQHQAAMLVHHAFTAPLREFRFENGRVAPPLYRKLPLNISVLALLIEGAQRSDGTLLPRVENGQVYVRQAVRGQNLDRAGISAQHMKLLNLLAEPATLDELAGQAELDHDEAHRVLHAFCLAGLVEVQAGGRMLQVVVYETDRQAAHQLRTTLSERQGQYIVKVVRDRLALQLVLRRTRPEALVLAFDQAMPDWLSDLCRQAAEAGGTKCIGIVDPETRAARAEDISRLGLCGLLVRPYQPAQILAELDSLFLNASDQPVDDLKEARAPKPASDLALPTPDLLMAGSTR